MSRIDEIRARCDAASPGPWVAAGCDNANAAVYTKDNYEKYENGINCYLIAELRRDDDTADPDQFNAWNDAELIARAREDIPLLLDELAQIKAERDRAVRHFVSGCPNIEFAEGGISCCSLNGKGCDDCASIWRGLEDDNE